VTYSIVFHNTVFLPPTCLLRLINKRNRVLLHPSPLPHAHLDTIANQRTAAILKKFPVWRNPRTNKLQNCRKMLRNPFTIIDILLNIMIVFYAIHTLWFSQESTSQFSELCCTYTTWWRAINNCLLACLFCGRKTGIASHKDSCFNLTNGRSSFGTGCTKIRVQGLAANLFSRIFIW